MEFTLLPTARLFAAPAGMSASDPPGAAAVVHDDAVGHYLGKALAPTAEAPAGSRRKRLWELPHNTLCPILGVCLSLVQLRRALGKAEGGEWASDDYQVHCGAINEASRRGPVCDALQRELEQRHDATIRRFAAAKTTEALESLWSDGFQGADVAGALWAGLTHARSDTTLRERICADVHMLQHQLGARQRADLARLQTLTDENLSLRAELRAGQERHARSLAERQAQNDILGTEVVRLRSQVILKESIAAALRDDLAALEADTSQAADRNETQRRLHAQLERIRRLEGDVARWRDEARSARRGADESAAAADAATRTSTAETPPPVAADLRDKSVLCVGGRTASVPVYRRLIEVTGGRFSHHDGGEKQSQAQLDASLAAADLVICQTGCVSHDAYWRVKEHCKRTGKRCVFVDNPSASSLARSLKLP